MNMTDFLEQKLLEHSFLNLPWSSPSTVYVALCTADPTETGDQTNEISATNYSRQSIDFSDVAADSNSEASLIENNLDIEFGQASVDWGEITHAAIMNAETDGNMLMYSQLTAFVTGEIFTSNYDTAVSLDQDGIIEGSETVTDTDGTGEYYEGRDYTMNYTNGEITVLSSGAMSDAADYLIDYEYANSKVINSGDLFRIPATELVVAFD
ncbi:phage tail fiber protein [Sporohalobacter salinus]|uniref:phage tail fiber protein n=1 Tax=Sporohalobacter salinus TaxID=1494606 RepID=UPI001961C0AB|nr:hypothetical protein [Sporohalobacter salinus]MBM7624788.1 hypothetical protein [Sporohalobacter salinus]